MSYSKTKQKKNPTKLKTKDSLVDSDKYQDFLQNLFAYTDLGYWLLSHMVETLA